MTKLPPCPFRPDPDTPPDHLGRPFCRCGARKDHPRHDLPVSEAQAVVNARYEHDEED